MTDFIFPDYIVRADDYTAAEKLASNVDSEWLFIPTTVDSEAGVFWRETSAIMPTTEEQLVDAWNVRLLISDQYETAQQYALKRKWWDKSWQFISYPSAEHVIEYQLLSA